MFSLPELDYSYDAFGKYIGKEIMELHHSKHHQTYVDKLNAAIDTETSLKEKPLSELLMNLKDLPDDVRTAVRNNGGGHYNHSLFWKWMSPQGGGEPTGKLATDLTAKYGSYQAFVDEFSEKAAGIFGSGWLWLQPDLTITATGLQDSPIMYGGAEPILGLDVWEHAYYLDYKNKRPDYIAAWWNVVNWEEVARRYDTE